MAVLSEAVRSAPGLRRGLRTIVLAGLACVAADAVVAASGHLDTDRALLVAVVLPAWLVFAGAAYAVLQTPRPRPGPEAESGSGLDPAPTPTPIRRPGPGRADPVRLWLVVALAAACQLPGLLVGPQSSSDAYRYVWDGRVQLSGTSPYRYAPLDDRLADLRDPVLFPGLPPETPSGVGTPDGLPDDPAGVRTLARADPRTVINRPAVPTAYPPVAQAWFTAIAAFTPWTAGTRGLQLAAALLAVATTAGLGRLLRSRSRDPAQALLWGWCPLVVLESGNGAHVDVLAAALVVAAMAMLSGGSLLVASRVLSGMPSGTGGLPGSPSGVSSRSGGTSPLLRTPRRAALAGGVLLGLAAATKLTPLLLLPILVSRRGTPSDPETTRVRRRPALWAPAAAVLTLGLSYLPHLLAVGPLVAGYLPGYLQEEGFSDGRDRFAVLGLLLPAQPRLLLAVALSVAVAALAAVRTDPWRPELAATWLFGAALLISTPAYPWYALPLVGLAVLAGRPEWLAVPVAGYVAYAGFRVPYLPGTAYAVAGLMVLAVTVHRRNSGRYSNYLWNTGSRKV